MQHFFLLLTFFVIRKEKIKMKKSPEVLNPLIFQFVSEFAVLKTKRKGLIREKGIFNYKWFAYKESYPGGLILWSLCHKP